MIYTVTFNPAIDYVLHVPKLKPGDVNRSTDESLQFGGKGINVSYILNQLGITNIALGFVAGFTGDALVQSLNKSGINSDFIRLDNGLTRINVKIKGSMETDINGKGPNIDNEALKTLFRKLDRLKDGDILILAGSIPQGIPQSIYEDIMVRLGNKNIHFAVDATGNLLLNVLKYHPFLIKPNHKELGDIFGIELKERSEIIKYAGKLQEMGAENVLVSMAGNGAILLDKNGISHIMGVPDGTIKNSVGAGDSMVAGFIAGWLSNNNYGDALKLGTAAGSATVFSENLATGKEIAEIYNKL